MLLLLLLRVLASPLCHAPVTYPNPFRLARRQVDMTCPAFGNRGMQFYTMQLRSADEGQTVFYKFEKRG